MKKHIISYAAIIAASLITPITAQVITWDGGGSGNDWNTPGNWTGGVVPTTGNTARLTGTGANDGLTDVTGTVSANRVDIRNDWTINGPGTIDITTISGSEIITGLDVDAVINTNINAVGGNGLDLLGRNLSTTTIGTTGSITGSGQLFSNNGTGNSVLTVDGSISGFSTFRNNTSDLVVSSTGSVNVNNFEFRPGNTVTTSSATAITSNVISGSGTLTGDLTTSATINLRSFVGGAENQIGNLAISGNFDSSGSWLIDLNESTTNKLDTVDVGGSLTLSGQSLEIDVVGSVAPHQNFTLATFQSGGLTGTFDASSITDFYVLYLDDRIILIPEVSTFLPLLACGLPWFFFRSRRKRA